MQPRSFTIKYRTNTIQKRFRSDNKRDRFLGRLQCTIGPNEPISYLEQGTADYRTFVARDVIRRFGGFREYGSFIGLSLI